MLPLSGSIRKRMPYMKNPSGAIVNVPQGMMRDIMKSVRPRKEKKVDPNSGITVEVDKGWDVVSKVELDIHLAKEAQAVALRQREIDVREARKAPKVVMMMPPAAPAPVESKSKE